MIFCNCIKQKFETESLVNSFLIVLDNFLMTFKKCSRIQNCHKLRFAFSEYFFPKYNRIQSKKIVLTRWSMFFFFTCFGPPWKNIYAKIEPIMNQRNAPEAHYYLCRLIWRLWIDEGWFSSKPGDNSVLTPGCEGYRSETRYSTRGDLQNQNLPYLTFINLYFKYLTATWLIINLNSASV